MRSAVNQLDGWELSVISMNNHSVHLSVYKCSYYYSQALTGTLLTNNYLTARGNYACEQMYVYITFKEIFIEPCVLSFIRKKL